MYLENGDPALVPGQHERLDGGELPEVLARLPLPALLPLPVLGDHPPVPGLSLDVNEDDLEEELEVLLLLLHVTQLGQDTLYGVRGQVGYRGLLSPLAL